MDKKLCAIEFPFHSPMEYFLPKMLRTLSLYHSLYLNGTPKKYFYVNPK